MQTPPKRISVARPQGRAVQPQIAAIISFNTGYITTATPRPRIQFITPILLLILPNSRVISCLTPSIFSVSSCLAYQPFFQLDPFIFSSQFLLGIGNFFGQFLLYTGHFQLDFINFFGLFPA